jgi:putative sterol carrier protein
MDARDFKEMLIGNLNATAAFMAGKLKVKGNLGLAMKLQTVLGKYEV